MHALPCSTSIDAEMEIGIVVKHNTCIPAYLVGTYVQTITGHRTSRRFEWFNE